jgi:hypothetical protein
MERRIERNIQGRIQDFKLAGGPHLKIAPSGGRRKFCLGYFVWKITILRQKIIFFPILGGARAGCAPWIRPWYKCTSIWNHRGLITKNIRTDEFSFRYNKQTSRKVWSCASLRSAQFLSAVPPLTWNPGSAPVYYALSVSPSVPFLEEVKMAGRRPGW